MKSEGTSKGNKKKDNDIAVADDLDCARAALSLKEFRLAQTYAQRVLQSSPLSLLERARADQILSIAHVHSAPDLYAVLELNRNTFTPQTLASNYRRLAHLLDPQLNPFAYASSAFKLAAKAYSVLSDPEKKSEYDAKLMIENAKKSKTDRFWTMCRSCYHVHEYERVHVGKKLRCQTQNCKEVFVAEELPIEPPVVEGADMYYCTWACYPLGFRGGYRFNQEKKQEEEKRTPPSMPVPVQPQAKKQKPTARKTVRQVDFGMKLRSSSTVEDFG